MGIAILEITDNRDPDEKLFECDTDEFQQLLDSYPHLYLTAIGTYLETVSTMRVDQLEQHLTFINDSLDDTEQSEASETVTKSFSLINDLIQKTLTEPTTSEFTFKEFIKRFSGLANGALEDRIERNKLFSTLNLLNINSMNCVLGPE